MAFLRTLNLLLANRVLIFLVWEYHLYLKAKVLGEKTQVSNSFLSHKVNSKETSEKLVKSWRLNQVRDLRAWAESQGLALFLSEALRPAL